jgi:hypothetical protein
MSANSRHSSSRLAAACRATVEQLEERQMMSTSPTLWADDTQGRLFTVNTGTGATHIVGTMPSVMYDIAFDAKGNLYGVDSTSSLWKINATNASATKVGSVGATVNSLVFSPTGTLYAAGSALYKVSTSTGAGTKIGSGLSGYSSSGDLAYDAAGNLFLSTTSNNLVKVSTNTGTASLVGAMSFNLVYGMAYGPDHVMYGLSDATSQIFTINTATGKGTLKSTFTGVSGVNGSTFQNEAVAAPGIEVDYNNIKIPDGNTFTSTADGTNFGSVTVGQSKTETFTIVNTSGATVNFTGSPRVSITGANAADFSVVVNPASPLPKGYYTTFQVKFAPKAAGTRNATITLANDNPNDPKYHFNITGTGVAAGQTIYACDSTGKLFTVNSATGATHVIGQMATVMYDITFDKAGNMYGMDAYDELWAINKTTAAISFVGSLGVYDSITSLTFGADGYLYAAGSDLYKIDVANGIFYDVGYLGGYQSAGDLAFDKYGNLVMTTTNNQLVKINTSTAQTTFLGNIGYSQVLGMVEGADGVLYGMSNASNQIFSINPITGQPGPAVTFTGVSGVYGAAISPV